MSINKLAKPYYILPIMVRFQVNKSNKILIHQLEHHLARVIDKKIHKDKEMQIIKDLINDGIIFQDEKGFVRLANEEEVETYDRDLYCYECFLPGYLAQCQSCQRAFHASCARRHPERPNYVIPKSNQIAEFNDDEDNEQRANSQQTNIVNGTKLKSCRVVLRREIFAAHNADKNNTDSTNNDLKPEVVCLGEVRPPTRQRNLPENEHPSMKHETDSGEINTENKFCTFCRLLKEANNLQPPNLDAVEMCHLLKYTLKRNQSWIKHKHIYRHFDSMKLTKKSIQLLKRILFPNRRLTTLETIRQKLQQNQYRLLNEFLAEIIELQYTMGVLFGSEHFEFDRSKFMVRDIQYDIQEIRRCPDCFRHSNDRITPFWFALPCVQRHELVYAKCTGHVYWPAKVVRVLYRADKYDVRFFGGNHERALIDKQNIRPIDEDIFESTKNKSVLLKKAMHEMLCYRALETYTLDHFSFYFTNQHEVDKIVKTVMSAIDVDFNKETNIKSLTKSRKTNTVTSLQKSFEQRNDFNCEENSSNCDNSLSEQSTPIPSRRRKPKTKIPTMTAKRLRLAAEERNTTNSESAESIVNLTPTPNPNSTSIATNEENVILQQQIEGFKAQIELLQHELAIAKRKSYCFVCLRPAEFLCCINASYCSKKCQAQHWISHQMTCTHK